MAHLISRNVFSNRGIFSSPSRSRPSNFVIWGQTGLEDYNRRYGREAGQPGLISGRTVTEEEYRYTRKGQSYQKPNLILPNDPVGRKLRKQAEQLGLISKQLMPGYTPSLTQRTTDRQFRAGSIRRSLSANTERRAMISEGTFGRG